jgi:RHS repeat-associated protein
MPVTTYYSANGQLFGESDTSGNRLDYLMDALGSVAGTVTSTAGTLAQLGNRYRYKPYGTQYVKTGTAPDPLFTWVGSWGYRETSRAYSDVYVRARHYSTGLGRWTAKDPVGYKNGWNLYAYGMDNSVSLIDPSGTVAIKAAGCCGPLIDSWIIDEFRAQFAGLTAYMGASDVLSGYDYARWALINQRYKCRNYFDFTAGLVGCGSLAKGAKHGCAGTVRLCGKCIRTSTLGNIMFGFMGIEAGLYTAALARLVRQVKRGNVDPYDELAYFFGAVLYQALNGESYSPRMRSPKFGLQAFCSEFKGLAEVYQTAFYEQDVSGSYITYDTCSSCGKPNPERRHGGNEPAASPADLFSVGFGILGCARP